MQKSKFELFQKHKIEGLQQITGGADATRMTDSSHPNTPATADVFLVMGENGNTTSDFDFAGRGCGDVWLATHAIEGGGPPPDPNNPMEWQRAPLDANFTFIG